MFDPASTAMNAAPLPKNWSLNGQVMEPKFDGWRLLIHVGPNGVNFYTRTGKAHAGKLPHIEAAVAHLPVHTWLDGEVVALDNNGMPEWGTVQSILGSNGVDSAGKLIYFAFDLLAFNSLDIRRLALSERRNAMGQCLTPSPNFRITPQFPADHKLHDQLVEQGYEGTIIKDPSKPYASGKRGQGWFKLKASDEMDVVVMGFKPGENSFAGMIGAIEFGQYQNGTLVHRGRCSGMTMKQRKDMTALQQEMIDSQAVISMAYMGIMPSGSPRHPQFKRLRTDKPAKDCVWI